LWHVRIVQPSTPLAAPSAAGFFFPAAPLFIFQEIRVLKDKICECVWVHFGALGYASTGPPLFSVTNGTGENSQGC
jgi:hypothetical protein